MLARIRKAQEKDESGFTLIELLVVMIIIGILAAIAIPVFLSQRAKAQDTSTQADVSTVAKEIASYYVDNSAAPTITIAAGRYVLNAAAAVPAIVNQDLGKASTNVVMLNTVVVGNYASSTQWCVDVNNPQGVRKIYKYSAKTGLATGVCVAADVT